MASNLLVLPLPLFGIVLPVAMLIAYVLSTMKVVRPCAPMSPCIARRSAVSSPALLVCFIAPWNIECLGDVITLPYLALRNFS